MIRAIVLPTRQMGWPTLGCNQQDLRGASERLVNCKPARMVPKVAGGRAANADEGITGTRADKRDDFQRMMRDCRAGRIDRILVKSISRFGRNSADCIEAVRELKMLGIAVAFEKEGIDTGRMTNEMYFSMYSASTMRKT